MSVDQDTDQDRGSGQLSMHDDWFASGWSSYLPQYQAMLLCMFFGTAAVRGLRGTIDEVLEQHFDGEHGPYFGRVGGSLDAPVAWTDPESLEYAGTEEERNRLRADAEEHQARCEQLLRTAGLPVPTTIRELADTMLAVGIATRHGDAWSMPDRLPGPETVLALTDDERAEIVNRRRLWERGPEEQALTDYLVDGLSRPAEVFTSVDRLAKATGMAEDDLRRALGRLIHQGDARIERGPGRERTALDDLKGHERFHLVLDWEHFEENGITVEPVR
ncbi:DUF6042 family protein [Streptomyces sp. TX20-6-3]|uniref:DUF6042 family protein n=1 Tax=Streptomyces sp. TX20-6-3 TaxID=3028705 RepID=UPI0029A1671C|nr:DUF6042 family protein [Streptomyces sp. TX20-6-3]MDX2561136.1 DUF6042 family protein [Streptomyces sp. TX20-6-3]